MPMTYSLEINLPEREAHCLSPSSDWVRNGWSYTFIYLLRGVGRMRRGGFCKPNATLGKVGFVESRDHVKYLFDNDD